MYKGYGQYCPLALAAELLCNRWTLLVISRVVEGCSTYNEILDGLPKISPSMLSKRLKELAAVELIERRHSEGKSSYSYHATPAAMELEGILDNLAIWGQRWARDNSLDDLDVAFLAWSMHLRMDVDAMPDERTVLEFSLSTPPFNVETFWLVVEDSEIDMCLKYPGYETDVLVEADLRVFVEAWRGFRDLREEIRSGSIKVQGPRALTDQFPDWLLLSMYAQYPRKTEGREKMLCHSSAPGVKKAIAN